MICNGKLGISLVQASKEAFTGGPTRQELTAHDYNNGEILLWHPSSSHYGSPDLEPPHGWEKIYGPFYLHVNEAFRHRLGRPDVGRREIGGHARAGEMAIRLGIGSALRG